jgi:prepilin-type N-terminal cleavage/methylation domain-containing protein
MKNLFIKKNKNNETSKQVLNSKRGFTIIETLVAIFVLLISTTGPLAFTQSGLRSAFLARDQVTAFYLAQESIETIKNVRDNNLIGYRDGDVSIDWLKKISDCGSIANVGDTASCNIGLIQNDNTSFDSCQPESCSLFYDANTYRFTLDGSAASKYVRTVYITRVSSDEIQVIVEVSWSSTFFTPKRIIVQENIFKKY